MLVLVGGMCFAAMLDTRSSELTTFKYCGRGLAVRQQRYRVFGSDDFILLFKDAQRSVQSPFDRAFERAGYMGSICFGVRYESLYHDACA